MLSDWFWQFFLCLQLMVGIFKISTKFIYEYQFYLIYSCIYNLTASLVWKFHKDGGIAPAFLGENYLKSEWKG